MIYCWLSSGPDSALMAFPNYGLHPISITDTFQVQVGSALSEPVDVLCAVSQGSLLGPILFICYIATLEDIIQDTSTSLLGYADDHTFYNSFLPMDEHLALKLYQW